MRKILPLISTLLFLAAAAPAAAAPEWTHPVSILSWKLAPGQPVACTASPNGAVTSATYSWTRDGVAIAAATSSQYFLRFADEGHELRCRLTVETADGRLSGESAPLVAPVIDDGPPRVVTGAPLLMPGRGMMVGQWTSVPAAMRDWYGTGAPEVILCQANPWTGVMGPTGAHWKFEFLREGAVVETMERDGDPMWQGSPAGWIGDNQPWPAHAPFVAWHALGPADLGKRYECRLTVSNGSGTATVTSPVFKLAKDAYTGVPVVDEPPVVTAPKSASGVLRRGSFQVGYAGKGKLKAKAGKYVIATGTAKRGKATLKLTAAGRKLLKRKHRLTVTVTAGGTTTKITLRA